MKFIIRDDDACGFTEPGDILSCYSGVWPDVPVSLSVTPFRIPGNDRNAPEYLKGDMRVIPLEENDGMVSFMREGLAAGTMDVTLHGYHHWRCQGLPEFVGCDDLYRKAQEGREYLEGLLDVTINTFVPPNNGISPQGLQAVASAGMNLAGMPKLWSMKARHLNLSSLACIPRVLWHSRVRGHRYPYLLEMGDHQEVNCHTVGPRSTANAIHRELAYCNSVNGVFVLATHYHAFDRLTVDGSRVGDVVYDLIDRAASWPDTEFIGFNSVWVGS